MKNLLKKCIDELAKPEPKLDYVRGILETLAEQEPVAPMPVFTRSDVPIPPIFLNKNTSSQANPHGLPADDAFKVLSDNPIQNG